MKCLLFALATFAVTATICSAEELVDNRVPLTFSGGHDIGPRDYGRPCVLIAAALGVKTEVFREAFSGVTPAKGGGPSGGEARRNKEALLKVLGPHGITNERIDEVSNFYRYRPQNGELWKHKDAKAHAIVENGKVIQVVVTDPGFGYSSPPKAAVTGLPDAELSVSLLFDQDFQKNGSIKAIQVESAAK